MRDLFILAFVLFCSTTCAQVILKGKINHYDGKSEVFYTPTMDGIIPFAARTGKRIKPNANGSFKIQVENKGYGTLKLGYYGLSYAFFHNENTEIKLVIDQSKINFPEGRKGEKVAHSVKQAATVSIDGDFAEVNRYYNRMLRSSTMTFRVGGSYLSLLVKEMETPERVVSFIDSLTQIEMNYIEALGEEVNSERPSPHPVTPKVKRFLENQVHAFYGSIFLSGMMLKRVEQGTLLLQNPRTPLTAYNPRWERLIEDFFRQASSSLYPSASSFEYNEFIQGMAYAADTYRTYHHDEIPPTSNDEMIIERLFRPPLALLDSLSLLDDKTILAYKLHNLSTFLYTQTYYSPVLLNAVNELKGQYSPHLRSYEEDIGRLKSYLKSSSLQFDKAKIIETNYVQFSDLVETFKGKNLYIDVWATWCGPCVKDFNYKSVLKPFVDKEIITVLYISIDKGVWKKKWMENMRFNQLEGYHVLADDVLIRDMWKYLGGREGVIPRYALIDKSGAVYLSEAARPSEPGKLAQQIESMVKNQ